jgi:hypothetical protein
MSQACRVSGKTMRVTMVKGDIKAPKRGNSQMRRRTAYHKQTKPKKMALTRTLTRTMGSFRYLYYSVQRI